MSCLKQFIKKVYIKFEDKILILKMVSDFLSKFNLSFKSNKTKIKTFKYFINKFVIMKTNKLIYVFGIFLSLSSYGYEVDWKDPKFDANSNFKVYGYWWFGYESMDSQVGVHDKEAKQGFTMNRVYVRFDGKVSEGDWKDLKYHITLEGAPGVDSGKNIFLKYAYFEHSLPFSLILRYGLQSTPTTNGGKNTNLENLWAHRYLDADGKAIWDQIGISSTSDLGVGLEQNTDYYNFLILVANGEGFKKKSNGHSILNTGLADLSEGSGDSYGYHIYGRFSITPFTTKKDIPIQLHISFPFQSENKFGIQKDEYEFIDNLSFTTQKISFLKGNPRAKQDIIYGTEIDTIFNYEGNKLGIGLGAVQKINRKSDALKIDENIINGNINIQNFYRNYYIPGSDALGLAKYIFLYYNTKQWGIVSRYYEHTSDNSFSVSLKSAERVSVLNQMLVEDIKDNGIIGDLSPEQSLKLIRSGTIDSGKAKMMVFLIAFEYFVNNAWKIALGMVDYSATIKSGERYKINPLNANNIKSKSGGTGYTTNDFADYVSSQAGIPTGFLTDNDLIGVNKKDRQIFIRSQYMW